MCTLLFAKLLPESIAFNTNLKEANNYCGKIWNFLFLRSESSRCWTKEKYLSSVKSGGGKRSSLQGLTTAKFGWAIMHVYQTEPTFVVRIPGVTAMSPCSQTLKIHRHWVTTIIQVATLLESSICDGRPISPWYFLYRFAKFLSNLKKKNYHYIALE